MIKIKKIVLLSKHENYIREGREGLDLSDRNRFEKNGKWEDRWINKSKYKYKI